MKPTVGRKVYFYSTAGHRAACDAGTDQPFDATIIFVQGDDSVNIMATNHTGDMQPILGVMFQGLGMAVPNGAHAAWMPYQLVQAEAVTQSQAVEVPAAPIPTLTEAVANAAAPAEANPAQTQLDLNPPA